MEHRIYIKFTHFIELGCSGNFYVNIDKNYIKDFYVNGIKTGDVNFKLEEKRDYEVEILLNNDIKINDLFGYENLNEEEKRKSRHVSIYLSDIILENFSKVGEITEIKKNKLEKATLINIKELKNTFQNCKNLKEVKIIGETEKIGDYTFYNCTSLTSITLPSSITSIGQSAFDSCTSLSSIILPSSITSIGQSAFYNCYSLSSITLPNSITSIGQNAFFQCFSLSSITLPNSITSISQSAFANCYFSYLQLPNSITSLPASAFTGCCTYVDLTTHENPPTIASTNSLFYNSATKCPYYFIAKGTLEKYKNATNWSTIYANCPNKFVELDI